MTLTAELFDLYNALEADYRRNEAQFPAAYLLLVSIADTASSITPHDALLLVGAAFPEHADRASALIARIAQERAA